VGTENREGKLACKACGAYIPVTFTDERQNVRCPQAACREVSTVPTFAEARAVCIYPAATPQAPAPSVAPMGYTIAVEEVVPFFLTITSDNGQTTEWEIDEQNDKVRADLERLGFRLTDAKRGLWLPPVPPMYLIATSHDSPDDFAHHLIGPFAGRDEAFATALDDPSYSSTSGAWEPTTWVADPSDHYGFRPDKRHPALGGLPAPEVLAPGEVLRARIAYRTRMADVLRARLTARPDATYLLAQAEAMEAAIAVAHAWLDAQGELEAPRG
jgi:hypothetical protein